MSDRALAVAAEFCRLVDTADLFEYLGLSKDASAEEAKTALQKKRRYMQGMQSNPKFKDSARFLIKNYRVLEEVLTDPRAHLAAAATAREEEKLPMLLLAVEGVMADGRVSQQEEQFLRTSALSLGISLETYERVLTEEALKRNAFVETQAHTNAHLDNAVSIHTMGAEPNTGEQSKLRGAEGHGWWDAAFTRLLLDVIPGGPGEMVDVYCRTALSAETVLPERRQLDWVGVDKSRERIHEATTRLARSDMAHLRKRVRLAHGEPENLPLQPESVDFVLAVRALGNLLDTRPVLDEAVRVLRPGGRLIVAEPDGFGENFIFDDHLVEYNFAFHKLVVEVDGVLGGRGSRISRGGLAVGPSLPGRMLAAGFTDLEVRVHGSNNLGLRTFQRFARRLRRYPQAMAKAARLPQDHPLLIDVLNEVDQLEARFPPDHRAMCGNVLPMYLAVGVKE
ncbi:MAG: methyltransferase domain-containing protein [Deltaproteobacteria bacterium]|nr:MAG: methyltransferase domain-containing protein [Deltaproteobacteria bacterium]